MTCFLENESTTNYSTPQRNYQQDSICHLNVHDIGIFVILLLYLFVKIYTVNALILKCANCHVFAFQTFHRDFTFTILHTIHIKPRINYFFNLFSRFCANREIREHKVTAKSSEFTVLVISLIK